MTPAYAAGLGGPSRTEISSQSVDRLANPIFTVFTPTYNRAYSLHGVYESLLRQTFRSFEWLIVDDGSTDDTRARVEQWTREDRIPIRYLYKDNGGNHTAWNTGVANARGALFLRLDSDDTCVDEALQVFYDTWCTIPEGERHRFTGVSCATQDENGKPSRTPVPDGVLDSNYLEVRLRHKVSGEGWGFHRIEVARMYAFPEPPGTKFVPEDFVWMRIASRFQERYINRALRIYHQSPSDQSRITAATPWRHAAGYALNRLSIIDDFHHLFWWNPRFFFKTAANYARSAWHAGMGVADQWRTMKSGYAKLMWLVMLPVAFAVLLRDLRWKRRLERERPRTIAAHPAP